MINIPNISLPDAIMSLRQEKEDLSSKIGKLNKENVQLSNRLEKLIKQNDDTNISTKVNIELSYKLDWANQKDDHIHVLPSITDDYSHDII